MVCGGAVGDVDHHGNDPHRVSHLGVAPGLEWERRPLLGGKVGTVVRLKRHSRTVMVRFDGNRTTNTPHRDYIEPVEA